MPSPVQHGPGRPSWGFPPLQRHQRRDLYHPGLPRPGTIRPRGFSPPRRFDLPPALRTRWVRCRSWGSCSPDPFERTGQRRVAAPLAPLRPRCSTVSNSEEYEVESSAASKALEPLRPGSTAVVPRSRSPLRSTSSPGCRRGFRPHWSPRTLESSASGRTMTRRTGIPGSSTSPETNGSSRDPQLPWGFRCIGRRSGAFRCSTPPSTGIPGRAGSFRGLPLRSPAAVARSVRPFHVTGLSKSHLLGQHSRRCRSISRSS
jgi:hypothetical protein